MHACREISVVGVSHSKEKLTNNSNFSAVFLKLNAKKRIRPDPAYKSFQVSQKPDVNGTVGSRETS